MLLDTCANLISLLVISTPKISSPWTEDFPILDLKKPPIFLANIPFGDEAFVSELFLAKLGFLNLIFFNFSRILEGVFVSKVSLFSVGAATLWVIVGSACLGFSTTGGVGCSGGVDGSSFGVLVVSAGAVSSFPLFAWTSSNHFSNIGIASSRLGVPDEEIFCFPSI